VDGASLVRALAARRFMATPAAARLSSGALALASFAIVARHAGSALSNCASLASNEGAAG
jgi:hypothetical protein